MRPQQLYLIATGTWFLAFGLQSVVFAWLVTIVLREPAELVGWAQSALLFPGMVLILLAGALADRIGPDRQALYAQVLAAVVPWILIFSLYQGWLSYSVMVVYALLMGVAQAFVTPARDGLLNHVADGKVQRLVLLSGLAQFGFQIVGYGIGALADGVGAISVLSMHSVILVLGALAYWRLRSISTVAPNPAKNQSILRGVMVGAKTVFASKVMRLVVAQNIAMACFFMGCFIVCFPLVVREVYAGTSLNLGVLNAANSAGLAITIIVILRIGYVRRPGRALLVAQLLGSLALFLGGIVDSFALFVACIFVWGLCGGAAMPMSRTLMQELAPPEQRARVMSFYAFSFMGAGPLGTLFCGYLSELYGPQMAIQLCAGLMFLVALSMSLFSVMWRTELEHTEVASA